MLTREELSNLVAGQGLCFLGVVSLGVEPEYAHFSQWLEEGNQGGLSYLNCHLEMRKDPRRLMPGATAAIIVGLRYRLASPNCFPAIASFATSADYHSVIKERGARIVEDLKKKCSSKEAVFRVVVDSAPVLERALAARTLNGFIGRNTCYIHPQYGSSLLLGEILTNLRLPCDDSPSEPGSGCGNCSLCQHACPASALSQDYVLDARKCVSYWTTQHRGPIPLSVWPALSKYYFGCDMCQMVCPHNQSSCNPGGGAVLPEVDRVAVLTSEEFERFFGGTPVHRLGCDLLRRNALIAMAVMRHPKLFSALAHETTGVVADTADAVREYLKNG